MKQTLLLTLFSFLLTAATAADINLSGACLEADLTLLEGAPANGKPTYSANGMVGGNPVLFAIFWEPSFLPAGGWFLSGNGQVIFYNTDDTTLPPATGVGTWSAAPGDPCGNPPPNISGSGALPVELIYFNASARDNHVRLEWATATESNNEGFEVQRSEKSNSNSTLSWEKIGFIQGHGTTIEGQKYVFVDKEPSLGNNYYRLKQLDYDGQFEYTDIRQVLIHKQKDEIVIYPNPVGDVLNIYIATDAVILDRKVNIIIYSVTGQLIKQYTIDYGEQKLDMSQFTSGLYLLEVQTDKDNWYQQVVVE